MFADQGSTEIIQGKNPVLEALKAGRPINRVLLARGASGGRAVAAILELARSRSIPVEIRDRRSLDRLVTSPAHHGIIAFAAAKGYVTLERLQCISAEKKEAALYCILDGIEDPQNLGAIIRTAAATGVHGMIIRSRRAAGLTDGVARASAGAVEHMTVARVANISQAVESLKRTGIWVVGIDLTGEMRYCEVDFRLPSAVVIGAEGRGLSALVRRRCDSVAAIPMAGSMTSLNASVAAALVMYEAFRQRKWPGARR